MGIKEQIKFSEKENSSKNLTEQIFEIILEYSHINIFNIKVSFEDLSIKEQIKKHLEKIAAFIDKNHTIKIVLPAFPFKSPNQEKTLGFLPDLGEYLGIKRLENICKKIETIYPPGGKVVICSDGRVFSDLFQVREENVTAYYKELASIIERENLTRIETFNIDYVFSDLSYDEMRHQLTNNYGEPLSTIKNNIKTLDAEAKIFTGLFRFVYEDMVVLNRKLNNTQRRKQSKDKTFKIVQRSHAWSNLIATYFPESIRISIHPQDLSTGKIGIQLVKCNYGWGTPWHNVVLLNEEGYSLVKHREAKKLRAKLMVTNKGFLCYSII